jgi:hypothetical protein
MQCSLSWIEWLERLDRVLKGTREDVRSLAGVGNSHAVAAVERSKRQLSALTNDLRLLDRSVLSPKPSAVHSDRAYNLQKALDSTVFHLGTVASAPVTESQTTRERALTAVNSALRDSSYEAAMLLEPRRHSA